MLKKAFEGELTQEWRKQQSDLPTAEALLQQIKQERQRHYDQQFTNWEKAVKNWESEGKEGRKPSKPSITKEQPLLQDNIDNLNLQPSGWGRINLTQIVQSMCLGKMLDKNKNEGQYSPYLGNINVRWGSFNLDNLKKMRFAETEMKRFSLKEKDLVICEGGEPGRCAIWKKNQEIKIQRLFIEYVFLII